MNYVSKEQIQTARQMDLLTYLRCYEPGELVHVSGSTYCTREHDSLKISNGKWYWFSRGFGGATALDYLVEVKGYPLPQAVEIVLGRAAVLPPTPCEKKTVREKKLLLPEKSKGSALAERYLIGRGIHPAIVKECIEAGLIYQAERTHNVVFVGYDKEGKARYAAVRATVGKYKGEATGSNKRFSFSIPPKEGSDQVHLFEAAIDLLSFATLERMKGQDWRQDHLLSLAGVFKTKRENVVPVALSRYLEDHPEIRTIHLHLDNDAVGRGAAKGIMGGLKGKYTVLDEPPACGKDINEQLLMKIGFKNRHKEENEQQR